MNSFNKLSTSDIQQRLNKQIPASYDIPASLSGNHLDSHIRKQQRKAAVLIPFLRMEDSWHILFIRRSIIENDMHSGQVAFAGGKYEESDASLTETALRETHEEIGINPNDVEVLGTLNPHYTISKFEVTPVVATLSWPYNLTLQTSEVSHAFTLPLDWLADENNYEIRYMQRENIEQPVPILYFKEYDGELLWGATAKMTLSLINTLRHHPA